MILKTETELQSGKYRIIRVLGQGGFGITYLAEHTMLDKMVAIKEFFPKDYCGRDNTSSLTIGTQNNIDIVAKLKDRFLKEAQNIKKLNHLGIVKIHEIFEENNTAYYVMDYIEGENLNEIVKHNGPLSEAKAVEYICKVGDALDYIHSRKMTHFDVKPANIMVRRSDDRPILIDFGLSKQYDIHGDATSTIMQGVSHGYSPIELYNIGSVLTFSPETDIYSLGATLYFLNTATVPPAPGEILERGLNYLSSCSHGIKSSIELAMQINRARRPRTVSIFIDSLTRCSNSIVENKRLNDETHLLNNEPLTDKVPKINKFKIIRNDSTPIYENDTVILEWNVSNSDKIFLNNRKLNIPIGREKFSVGENAGIKTFLLTASNDDFDTCKSIDINVVRYEEPTIEILRIKNSPPFYVGDRLTLEWKVKNAKSVMINGEVYSTEGEMNFDIFNQGINVFKISASNDRYTVSNSVSIKVDEIKISKLMSLFIKPEISHNDPDYKIKEAARSLESTLDDNSFIGCIGRVLLFGLICFVVFSLATNLIVWIATLLLGFPISAMIVGSIEYHISKNRWIKLNPDDPRNKYLR